MGYSLTMTGPDYLYEHGQSIWSFDDPPRFISGRPRILSRIQKGERVNLSEAIRKETDYHEHYAREAVNNITFELTASQMLRASLLTDKQLHVNFLKSITGSSEIEHRNYISSKYLTSIVPFIEDVKLSDLIKLRNRETEAFIQYRRALNEAINEFKSEETEFREKDARALYSDIIEPKLSALDRKINLAKKDLIMKSYRPIIAVVGAISFGVYSGFIPAELSAIAKTIGFTKIAADILDKALMLGDANNTVKDNELYFLWQVRNKAAK